jgi:hypothetical protein
VQDDFLLGLHCALANAGLDGVDGTFSLSSRTTAVCPTLGFFFFSMSLQMSRSEGGYFLESPHTLHPPHFPGLPMAHDGTGSRVFLDLELDLEPDEVFAGETNVEGDEHTAGSNKLETIEFSLMNPLHFFPWQCPANFRQSILFLLITSMQ